MGAKTANVYIRLEPGVKEQAENVLRQLGLPLSSAVNIFLKQVAMKRCIPFSIELPTQKPLELAAMSKSELDAELDKGYQEAVAGQGRKAYDVFEDMSRDYGL